MYCVVHDTSEMYPSLFPSAEFHPYVLKCILSLIRFILYKFGKAVWIVDAGF